MTPFQEITERFLLPRELYGNPFIVHPLQVQAVNDAALWSTVGLFLDTGTGKTLVESLLSLFRIMQGAETSIIIMPPGLIRQWAVWLSRITRADGSPLRVTEYVGTPKVRQSLPLNVDFVLVGSQIFKIDYERFAKHFSGRVYHVGVDEATMVSNIETDTHEKVYEFSLGMTPHLLTGTPVSNPLDAYGLLKFTNPGCYRSFRHFQNMHVEEVDFWGKPAKFCNLDMLKENLATNSVRILFEDMYPDAEQPLFVPLPYDLDPAHLRLYRRLADEELLELESGGKIDATSASKLTHALGQIVANYGFFAEDPRKVSKTVDMLDERLREIFPGKLVVFANYRMTIKLLLERFSRQGAVAINGDASAKQKDAAVQRFINDPDCRMVVIHPKSGGFGLDGLQHVSHHMAFVEPVRDPRTFHQCVARLKRTGQRRRVVVTLLSAVGTLQMRAVRDLVRNDTIASQVIHTASDLRAAIFGN